MKYSDSLNLSYRKSYPIIKLSDVFYYNGDYRVIKNIQNSPWFINNSDVGRQIAIERITAILSKIDRIISIFNEHFPKMVIRQISIGGSFLFKSDSINDIDFNVIVSGSYFDYKDIFEIESIKDDVITNVKKISFMVFGEDDLSRDTGVVDTIETSDYIHTSLCFREGLVFLLRNVIIFGFDFSNQEIDKKNLIIRIKRQLYHARLLIDSKICVNRTLNENQFKAISRICEAAFYLSLIYPDTNFSPKNILLKERALIRTNDTDLNIEWLNNVEGKVDKILNKSIIDATI